MSSSQVSATSSNFSCMLNTCYAIREHETSHGREFPSIPDYQVDQADKLATWMSTEQAFKELKGLKLSGLKLGDLPDQIYEWTNLEWMTISGNQLASLSSRINKLVNLKEFRCSSNWLTKVPEELFALPKLSHVDLSHNHLEELPTGLEAITREFTLKVDGNENLKPFQGIEKMMYNGTFHLHHAHCTLISDAVNANSD